MHHIATHCTILQHTAPYCNTLHHIATHCTILQHTAPYCNTLYHVCLRPSRHPQPCSCTRNTQQPIATHSNTLHHGPPRHPRPCFCPHAPVQFLFPPHFGYFIYLYIYMCMYINCKFVYDENIYIYTRKTCSIPICSPVCHFVYIFMSLLLLPWGTYVNISMYLHIYTYICDIYIYIYLWPMYLFASQRMIEIGIYRSDRNRYIYIQIALGQKKV